VTDIIRAIGNQSHRADGGRLRRRAWIRLMLGDLDRVNRRSVLTKDKITTFTSEGNQDNPASQVDRFSPLADTADPVSSIDLMALLSFLSNVNTRSPET